MMEPKLIYLKKAEQTTNKMRIPKEVIERMGREFYMEIYNDKVVLIPAKKGA